MKVKTGMGIALLALAAAVAGVARASTGGCVLVEVPGPMVLPDASLHPAGTLEICKTRVYSPVSYLHRTSVNGIPVGEFLSRIARDAVEAPLPSEPYVEFIRSASGLYRLVGFGWPAGKRRETFFLLGESSDVRMASARSGAEAPRRPEDKPVLLAARIE